MRMRMLITAVVAVTSLGLSTIESMKDSLTLATASGANGAPAAATEGHAGEAEHGEGGHEEAEHKIIVTSPQEKDVTLTERYVCQIHSRRHIEICALDEGYLQSVDVNEGQHVKKGELMFSILPTLYQARLDSDLAEARLAQVELDNSRSLAAQNIVSGQDVKLAEARLAKAQAEVEQAQAELSFASIKAPFDGIVDRLHEREGSLLEEGTRLTTLSDNEVMWVYFNVPEARYLTYQASMNKPGATDDLDVKLELANHEMFGEDGKIGAIEAVFNNETGNIAFRADFPNPDGLLRHGQTGTVLIRRHKSDAIVIPQRATYEILAKTYVYVVDDDNVVHQREIKIQTEQEDVFVIASGLEVGDRIILEGLRQVNDGDKIDFEYVAPETVMTNLKYHAE